MVGEMEEEENIDTDVNEMVVNDDIQMEDADNGVGEAKEEASIKAEEI